MKSKNQLGVLLVGVLLSSLSLAKSYTCTSDKFPEGYGSTIVYDDQVSAGEMFPHLDFKLNKTSMGNDIFKASGDYDGFAQLNENHTPVIYFNWYAGAFGSEEEQKLIPRTLVFYDFDGNFENTQTVFVGNIEWTQIDGVSAKVEKHYVYKCALN